MSDDYKAQFAAAVDELWASDLNARIGELNAEIRRLEAECRYWERTNDWLGAAKPMGILIDKRLQQWDLVEEKIRRVDELIERYIAAIGERPDSRQLDRLATWLLKGAEELSEYKILTERQMRTRNREKEFPSFTVDLYEQSADSGNKYNPPIAEWNGGLWRREYVKLPSDHEDKRKYNGRPVKRELNQ